MFHAIINHIISSSRFGKGKETTKSRITECYNIHRRNHENFGNLQKTLEKSIRHQSNPNGKIINLTKHSFTKAEYKLFLKKIKLYTNPESIQ